MARWPDRGRRARAPPAPGAERGAPRGPGARAEEAGTATPVVTGRVQRWLVGFGGIELDAVAQGTVEIGLPARVFQHWDTRSSAWALEPGTYALQIGPSIATSALTAEVKLA